MGKSIFFSSSFPQLGSEWTVPKLFVVLLLWCLMSICVMLLFLQLFWFQSSTFGNIKVLGMVRQVRPAFQ